MLEHDTECRAQHMQVNDDIDDLNGCDCPLIDRIRLQDQQDISAALWPLLQPIVDWIAGVNMVKLHNASDDRNA